jgi:hypothetical protein
MLTSLLEFGGFIKNLVFSVSPQKLSLKESINGSVRAVGFK